MHISIKNTNRGIELVAGSGESLKALVPADDANQQNPRQFYVYGHLDSSDTIFYIGKGTRRRAWSSDRHPLWHRYVETHLNGNYRVLILQDDLTPEDAEYFEAQWIAQHADTLVNWGNAGRDDDMEAVEQYWNLRNANLALIREAKAMEKTDLEEASKMYRSAIDALSTYVPLRIEKGLVGRLLDEEANELGRNGELQALDRLTICLVKLGRAGEAAHHVEQYFAIYRRDLYLKGATRIKKRVEKAISRAQRSAAQSRK